MKFDKYAFYEKSVQTPDLHVDLFSSIYQELRGKEAHRLREDFCGTFLICCEWVKKNKKNSALGIDLDPEPLEYGKKNHASHLSPEQKKRILLRRADVRTPTSPLVDLIVGCNFSFFIFKQREVLKYYFRSCLKSLHSKGVLILEMSGGPGMISSTKEQKTVKLENHEKFLYIWDQKMFDPINHNAEYAIHFKTPGEKLRRDVFTYDWRLWTLPEVREILLEAGFKKTCVYWETEHKGKGTGEYIQTEYGDNAYSWIAYVVGIK